MNDLFWWWDSKIPAERVALLFDRADCPTLRQVVDQAQRLGIHFLAAASRRYADRRDAHTVVRGFLRGTAPVVAGSQTWPVTEMPKGRTVE